MRVLLTGGTGFVGSWTVPALLARGLDVRLLVRDEAKADAMLARRGVRSRSGRAHSGRHARHGRGRPSRRRVRCHHPRSGGDRRDRRSRLAATQHRRRPDGRGCGARRRTGPGGPRLERRGVRPASRSGHHRRVNAGVAPDRLRTIQGRDRTGASVAAEPRSSDHDRVPGRRRWSGPAVPRRDPRRNCGGARARLADGAGRRCPHRCA